MKTLTCWWPKECYIQQPSEITDPRYLPSHTHLTLHHLHSNISKQLKWHSTTWSITYMRNRGRICKGVAQSTCGDKARQLPTAISVPLQPSKTMAEVPWELDFHPGRPTFQPLAKLGIPASSPRWWYQDIKESGEDKEAGQTWLHGPKQYKLKPDSHSFHISYRFLNLSYVFTHPGDFCKWQWSPHPS